MKNELVDAVERELRLVGITPTIRHDTRHVKVMWNHRGQVRTQVVAKTASDYRALLNVRGQVRRMLRQDGISPGVQPQNEVSLLKKAFTIPPPMEPLGERVKRLEEQVSALTDLLLDTGSDPVVKLEVSVNGKKYTVPPQIQEIPEIPVPDFLSSPEPKKRKRLKGGEIRRNILSVLEYRMTKSPSMIGKEIGKEVNYVSAYLNKLKVEGEIENIGRGQWRKRVPLNGKEKM